MLANVNIIKNVTDMMENDNLPELMMMPSFTIHGYKTFLHTLEYR